LQMGKGKIGAQCGHATLGAVNVTKRRAKKSKFFSKVMKTWSWIGQKKICLKVNNEQEL